MDFLELDGSHGEGGGQILRTALFLSSVLGKPFRITNIRANREKPGLKRQHLHIVKLLKDLCSAKVEGDKLGSEELVYIPGDMKPGVYKVNFGSAGSIPLFLQTILSLSPFVSGRLEIEVVGGTEILNSPTIDWVRFVYLPCIRCIALSLRLEVMSRGYYPAGGGVVKLTAEGGLLNKGNNLKKTFLRERQGDIRRLHLLSVAEERLRERKVVERQVVGVLEVLEREGFPKPEIYRQYVRSFSIGTSVTLWLEDTKGNLLGADNVGVRGKPAEVVGQECALKLVEDWNTGATVDRHLADHLVPWIALFGGAIKVPRFTRHLETNVWICERFLGAETFEVSRDKGFIRAVL